MENYLTILCLGFLINDSGIRVVIMEIQDDVCEALRTWKMRSYSLAAIIVPTVMCYYPSK